MFGLSWGVKVIHVAGPDYPYLGQIPPLSSILRVYLGRLTATSAHAPNIHNSVTIQDKLMKL